MNQSTIYLAILLGFFSSFSFGQNKYLDDKGKEHLLGKVELSDFKKESFSDWFENETIVVPLSKEAKKNLKDLEVKVFLGTWCGDSKKLVPQFVKLWEESGLPLDNLEFIALHGEGSEYKRSPERTEEGLNIHRVPTFIFYENGIEKARIVESPANDLLTDMEQIGRGFPSKPNYRAVSMLDEFLKGNEIDSLQEKDEYWELANNLYREVKKASELNTYGYVLKAAGKEKEAEFVFRMNKVLFRYNPNTWDSLGEFYFDQEKYDLAKENYEKVVQIDSKNENAVEMLAEIGKKVKK